MSGSAVPWYHEVVATCPVCGRPVHRDDPRALEIREKDDTRLRRLGHLRCVRPDWKP